jgi:hypothetical protein
MGFLEVWGPELQSHSPHPNDGPSVTQSNNTIVAVTFIYRTLPSGQGFCMDFVSCNLQFYIYVNFVK